MIRQKAASLPAHRRYPDDAPAFSVPDARPRIVAYFERCNALKATVDQIAAGWMLVTLQERIHEGACVGDDEGAGLADKLTKLCRD